MLELRMLKQFLRRRPAQSQVAAAQQIARQMAVPAERDTRRPAQPINSRPKPTSLRRMQENLPTVRPLEKSSGTRTTKKEAIGPEQIPGAPLPTPKAMPNPHSGDARPLSTPTPNELAKLASKPHVSTARQSRPMRPETVKQTTPQSALQESDQGNYHTIIRFAPKEAGKLRSIITTWLHEKNIPLSFGSTQAHHDSANKLFAETIKTEKITSRYDELKIVENTDGYFSTTIILATSPTDCYLEVDIVSPDGIFARPPRFIRRVAGFGSVDSAPNGWHAAPVEIDADELSSLVEYVNSPARALPVFVIGTTSDMTLQDKIGEAKRTWAKFLPGNAVLAVLNPDASFRAVDAFGSALAPSPWSIRTYVPGLDSSAPFEGRRHRFLGQARLLDDNPTHTASRLGRIATRERALTPAPEQLRHAHKSLGEARNRILVKGEFYRDRTRQETLRLIAADHGENVTAPHILNDEEVRNVSILKQLIEASLLTDNLTMKLAEAYDARLSSDALESRLNELTERLSITIDERDAQAEDNRVLYSLIDELEDEKEELSLQNSLLAVSARTSSHSPSETEAFSEVEALSTLLSEIGSFSDLVESFAEFERFGVFLTCDLKEVAQLDDIDTNGRAIAQTLRALHTLMDYLRAKRDGNFEGSMHTYLTDTPSGYFKVSQKMHASRESQSTMAQYGQLRQLPAPESIAQSGFVEMQAHFKLEKIGIKSPRLHYFDASATSGRVAVGYIGPHLQTDGTN